MTKYQTEKDYYNLIRESYTEGFDLEMKKTKSKNDRDDIINFHFESDIYCRKFLKQYDLYGYVRSYCCYNKGFGIKNTHANIEQIKIDVDEFNKKHIKPIIIKKTSDVDCCVCLDPSTNLTNCGHLLCISCMYSLTEKLCPVCRQELIIFDP
jgi:hypothetical protein